MQSSSQIITTNKPTPSFIYTGQMPFLSPNQQVQHKVYLLMQLFSVIASGMFRV